MNTESIRSTRGRIEREIDLSSTSSRDKGNTDVLLDCGLHIGSELFVLGNGNSGHHRNRVLSSDGDILGVFTKPVLRVGLMMACYIHSR